jgi:hypothetical protein
MKRKTKICQNCKKEFIIEPEDFEFYQKIKVPPPTWCPECRLVRRMVFKNERKLYKRKCDLCGENILSIYHQEQEFPVYCPKCWWSDKWDPIDYERDYDFSRSFFDQFNELNKVVPKMNLVLEQSRLVNSEYCHNVGPLKNCYLIFGGGHLENCYYCDKLNHSKDCLDCTSVTKVERSYQCFNCYNSYNLKFSRECENCLNLFFVKIVLIVQIVLVV